MVSIPLILFDSNSWNWLLHQVVHFLWDEQVSVFTWFSRLTFIGGDLTYFYDSPANWRSHSFFLSLFDSLLFNERLLESFAELKLE